MATLVRRTILLLVMALAMVPLTGTVASSAVTKYTFNDMVLTDADGTQVTGEIEASTKEVRKRTTIYCGYFTDDYQDSLG